MTRRLRPPPGLVLATEALIGITRYPRDRTLEVRGRYRDPATLAGAFEQALASGAEGLLAAPGPETRAALARLGPTAPVYALVPNVPQYVRDAADRGLIGAALKRLRGASPATLLRLGLTGLLHAGGVLRSDFIGMVPLLLELECASLGARRLEGVVLAATLTDLALAGGHRALFHHYVGFVRGRFGARAGFETHNLGHLLDRLAEWDVTPDLVVGPVNARGFLMKPAAADVLAALAGSTCPVLAKEVRAGGTLPLAEGARWARGHGAEGVVVDLVDLDDGPADLAGLAR